MNIKEVIKLEKLSDQGYGATWEQVALNLQTQRDELLVALRQVRDFGTLSQKKLDHEYCYNDMRRIAERAIARAEHSEGAQ